MQRRVLEKEFFDRKALKVAEDLLGKYLVRKIGKKEEALMINEVEAYFGSRDKGSHAHKGKTKRNEIMFGQAGHFYIYLCYGMYEMLNLVVDKEDYPAAVLIRGAGKYHGPGKLTRALNIDRKLNHKKIEPESGLWIEDRGEKIKKSDVEKTARIGINYADEWENKPYRFVLKNR